MTRVYLFARLYIAEMIKLVAKVVRCMCKRWWIFDGVKLGEQIEFNFSFVRIDRKHVFSWFNYYRRVMLEDRCNGFYSFFCYSFPLTFLIRYECITSIYKITIFFFIVKLIFIF